MAASDHKHRAKKRFGQNFLHDQNLINRIIKLMNIQSQDTVVEIGPGLGALTEQLVEDAGTLHCVEIDRDLAGVINTKFCLNKNFTLHEQDALKFDFGAVAGDTPLRVVGNLPYNISTPLIFHILSYFENIKDMHFMLQKEVVQRMAAEPGSKTYGRLSVMVQYHCHVDELLHVPPAAFKPAPKVDSAIVRLEPKDPSKLNATDVKHLNKIVTLAFNQRRKTLRNTLKSVLDEEAIKALGVNPQARPETLSLEEYIKIANATYTK